MIPCFPDRQHLENLGMTRIEVRWGTKKAMKDLHAGEARLIMQMGKQADGDLWLGTFLQITTCGKSVPIWLVQRIQQLHNCSKWTGHQLIWMNSRSLSQKSSPSSLWLIFMHDLYSLTPLCTCLSSVCAGAVKGLRAQQKLTEDTHTVQNLLTRFLRHH